MLFRKYCTTKDESFADALVRYCRSYRVCDPMVGYVISCYAFILCRPLSIERLLSSLPLGVLREPCHESARALDNVAAPGEVEVQQQTVEHYSNPNYLRPAGANVVASINRQGYLSASPPTPEKPSPPGK